MDSSFIAEIEYARTDGFAVQQRAQIAFRDPSRGDSRFRRLNTYSWSDESGDRSCCDLPIACAWRADGHFAIAGALAPGCYRKMQQSPIDAVEDDHQVAVAGIDENQKQFRSPRYR